MSTSFARQMAGSERALWLIGAALLQPRQMPNLLDSLVTVGRGAATAANELFDEVSDRVFNTAVLLGLG